MDLQPHYTYIDNQGYVCERGDWLVDGYPRRYRCRKTHKDCPACTPAWLIGACAACVCLLTLTILLWLTGATLIW